MTHELRMTTSKDGHTAILICPYCSYLALAAIGADGMIDLRNKITTNRGDTSVAHSFSSSAKGVGMSLGFGGIEFS